MSTSDANRFSGSPVLRSPEREIALSAVICTYNRYDLLPEAIESLVKQDGPVDLFEIIVVDNSPDQAGATRFGQRYSGLSNLTYLVEPKPGLSNARNKGTAVALGRIVAFIDDDARASRPGPKSCCTLMPYLTAGRGSWAARLCRVGQTRNRRGLASRRSAISR
jgi:glycosyltransferase involved in cell wall biosynthesis